HPVLDHSTGREGGRHRAEDALQQAHRPRQDCRSQHQEARASGQIRQEELAKTAMLLNYTSILEPEQTIAEIQKMLTKHGVRSIMTDYDGAQVSGVSFSMDVGGRKMAFRM